MNKNPNLSPTAAPMPVQAPARRARNFEEVALGYEQAAAIGEARRCLGCANAPCRTGCPVGVRIPEFIAKVAEGDFAAAWELLSAENSLPAVCGRVCPQENQCQAVCVRGKKGESVAIGRLERFVADWHRAQAGAAPAVPPANGISVAVVGSGPAGLACAGELARMGYAVTVYEALHTPGGVLAYGIPAFRLPKSILSEEIAALTAMGVTLQTDTVIGRTVGVQELLQSGFSAVFLGSGAGLPHFMGIPGETLCGVFSANEWLTRINLMHAADPGAMTPLMPARRVVVVGGGNVAMDAARCALRCGAEVTVVYRRGREELPARAEEIEHAEEEGVCFRLLANPVEVLGDENGFVRGIRCDTMTLGEPDESGRRRPVAQPGAQFTLPCDAVIMAIGTTPNPLLHRTTPGLQADRRGRLITGEGCCRTSVPGVFAGGDAVTGAATVIQAMGAGRQAAREIDRYIKEKSHADH